LNKRAILSFCVSFVRGGRNAAEPDCRPFTTRRVFFWRVYFMKKIGYGLLACLLGSSLCSVAAAQEFNYKGMITSDLRLTVPGKDMPSDVEAVRFDRTDNTIRATGAFRWGKVDAMADLSLTFSGKSEVDELRTLQDRTKVDPFYFESEALFIRISDFIIDGLDIQVGRQIVDWGAADKFRPTSVINGLDLEDPQDFGRRVANEMISLTYAPGWEIDGEETPIFSEFSFQVVWVPRFRSGLVPYSSEYAFSRPNEFRRFVKSQLLHNLVDLQEMFLHYGGSILYDVRVEEPSFAIENSQVGMRAGFSLLGVDLHFMAYYGFDHNMQPNTVNVNAVSTDPGVSAAIRENIHYVAGTDTERDNLMKLMKSFGEEGLITTLTGYTDVNLKYPRVWVVGADFATSLDFLGGVGFWGEVAVTIHDDVPIYIDINGTEIGGQYQAKKGAFVKAVVGLDNTFTKWLYINTQYIYGFVDEFGKDDLGHYLMVNADFKAVNEQMLFRLSGVIQLTDPSAVIMPSLSFKFWPATELVAGALINVGKASSKFGNRTVGPNYLFFQAKYAF